MRIRTVVWLLVAVGLIFICYAGAYGTYHVLMVLNTGEKPHSLCALCPEFLQVVQDFLTLALRGLACLGAGQMVYLTYKRYGFGSKYNL